MLPARAVATREVARLLLLLLLTPSSSSSGSRRCLEEGRLLRAGRVEPRAFDAVGCAHDDMDGTGTQKAVSVAQSMAIHGLA